MCTFGNTLLLRTCIEIFSAEPAPASSELNQSAWQTALFGPEKGLDQSEPSRQPGVMVRLSLTFSIGKVDVLLLVQAATNYHPCHPGQSPTLRPALQPPSQIMGAGHNPLPRWTRGPAAVSIRADAAAG